MEHTETTYIYHDGLRHFDKMEWRDVEGFSGWVVVECNCKLVMKEAPNDYSQLHPASDKVELPSLHTGNGNESL